MCELRIKDRLNIILKNKNVFLVFLSVTASLQKNELKKET